LILRHQTSIFVNTNGYNLKSGKLGVINPYHSAIIARILAENAWDIALGSFGQTTTMAGGRTADPWSMNP
jgi:hypothetical protein